MSDLHDRLLQLLTPYVSPIIARGINRALRDRGKDKKELLPEEARVIRVQLERGARVFADPSALPALRQALDDLIGTHARREPVKLSIRNEAELNEALTKTRAVCDDWQLARMASQRIATIVSELGRNVISYTAGGTVELVPIEDEAPRVLIRATDKGPGISDLEAVRSGNYKSKTGLGKGIVGCERLADRFQIRTGRKGTIVEAEIEL
jgi:serine/threonine-protein kinase RsbT